MNAKALGDSNSAPTTSTLEQENDQEDICTDDDDDDADDERCSYSTAAPTSTTRTALTTANHNNHRSRITTFKLEPEIIPRVSMASRPSDASQLSDCLELESPTEAQLKEIRERSRRKVKRLVAAVGVSLTILCVVLVIVSLSFGPKLEELGSSGAKDKSPFQIQKETSSNQQQRINNASKENPTVGRR